LSEYYSEKESDPKLVDIWTELKAAYPEKTDPSITLTNAEEPSDKPMFRQPSKRGSKERCKPGKESHKIQVREAYSTLERIKAEYTD